eukprot:5960110-Pleurochrysis_carterae.AAC.2
MCVSRAWLQARDPGELRFIVLMRDPIMWAIRRFALASSHRLLLIAFLQPIVSFLASSHSRRVAKRAASVGMRLVLVIFALSLFSPQQSSHRPTHGASLALCRRAFSEWSMFTLGWRWDKNLDFMKSMRMQAGCGHVRKYEIEVLAADLLLVELSRFVGMKLLRPNA